MAIREGRVDDFRRFVDDLMTTRRIEWAQSQRRRGITRQVTTVSSKGDRSLAIMYLEGSEPGEALSRLEASRDEFDQWLAGRVAELLEGPIVAEVIADTAPKPGPWRGWRGWRR